MLPVNGLPKSDWCNGMPRAKKPSAVVIAPSFTGKLDLPKKVNLAKCLGVENLTGHCQSAVLEVIDNHKRAYAAVKRQSVKTTPGNVSEELRRLVTRLDRGASLKFSLDAQNSGLDDVTFDRLKAVWGHPTAIRDVACSRIAELAAMPRVRWDQECLRATCSQVRLVFETFASPSLQSRKKRFRRFALAILKLAGTENESISGKNINRIDQYLSSRLV